MIVTIIGTRPQLIKAYSVSKALTALGIEEIVIDSNQHYSEHMNNNLVIELGYNNIIKCKQEPTTLQILITSIEKTAKSYLKKANAIVVYGDTNTTLAGALIAQKNNLPILHIESGERSFNDAMPEEKNRIFVDYLSTYCLCVNQKAKNNITTFTKSKKIIVGDVMLDTLLSVSSNVQEPNFIDHKEYYYFTLHRASNTGDVGTVQKILNELGQLKYHVLWPMHPRIGAMRKSLEIPQNVQIVKPLTYLQSLSALKFSKAVFTDSGGLQKEAYWMQKKCITLRTDTEWTETLKGNWNTLVPVITHKNLKQALEKIPDTTLWSLKPFGNGKASNKIAQLIKSEF